MCLWGPAQALGAAQVICFIKRKHCHSESPFLLKAVRDNISSYLRPKQDILEVCNWKRLKGHSISGLHSSVTAYICARLHSLVLPLPNASGSIGKPQTHSFYAERRAVLLWAAAQGCVLGHDMGIWQPFAGFSTAGYTEALMCPLVSTKGTKLFPEWGIIFSSPQKENMTVCASNQISKYFIFHISKRNQRKRAIFFMLEKGNLLHAGRGQSSLIGRIPCKDVFVAVLYCVFTVT